MNKISSMENSNFDTYQDISKLLEKNKGMPKSQEESQVLTEERKSSKGVFERNVEDNYEIFQYDSHDQLANALEKIDTQPDTEKDIKIRKSSKKSVWVQCEKDDCNKWRRVDHVHDVSGLETSKWVCSMNDDPLHNDCTLSQESIPGENGTPIIDDNLLTSVYSSHQCGDIVLGKMAGYPWWPGIIEEDPDYNCHYYVEERPKKTVVSYHVTFFGKSVSRAWLNETSVTIYDGQETVEDLGQLCQKGRLQHSKKVEQALEQAKKALEYSHEKRLRKFGFLRRYKGKDRPVVDKSSKVDSKTSGDTLKIASSSHGSTKTSSMGKETARKARKNKEEKSERKRLSNITNKQQKNKRKSSSTGNSSSMSESSNNLSHNSSSISSNSSIGKKKKTKVINNSSLFTSETSTGSISKEIKQLEKEVASKNMDSSNEQSNLIIDESASSSVDFTEQPALTSEQKTEQPTLASETNEKKEPISATAEKASVVLSTDIDKSVTSLECKSATSEQNEAIPTDEVQDITLSPITSSQHHAENMILKYNNKEDVDNALTSNKKDSTKKSSKEMKAPSKKRKVESNNCTVEKPSKKSKKEKNEMKTKTISRKSKKEDVKKAEGKNVQKSSVKSATTEPQSSVKSATTEPQSSVKSVTTEPQSERESKDSKESETMEANKGVCDVPKEIFVKDKTAPQEKMEFDHETNIENEIKKSEKSNVDGNISPLNQENNTSPEEIMPSNPANQKELTIEKSENQKNDVVLKKSDKKSSVKTLPNLVKPKLPSVSATEVLKNKNKGVDNVPKLKKPSFKAPAKKTASAEKTVPSSKPPKPAKSLHNEDAKVPEKQDGGKTNEKPAKCNDNSVVDEDDVDIDSMLADN